MVLFPSRFFSTHHTCEYIHPAIFITHQFYVSGADLRSNETCILEWKIKNISFMFYVCLYLISQGVRHEETKKTSVVSL